MQWYLYLATIQKLAHYFVYTKLQTNSSDFVLLKFFDFQPIKKRHYKEIALALKNSGKAVYNLSMQKFSALRYINWFIGRMLCCSCIQGYYSSL